VDWDLKVNHLKISAIQADGFEVTRLALKDAVAESQQRRRMKLRNPAMNWKRKGENFTAYDSNTVLILKPESSQLFQFIHLKSKLKPVRQTIPL